ncbi:MAG: MFS transporter [bacterium]|nr:MFS transporter [bacterium]
MRHNRNIIYIAGFLFSIPIALTAYINSSALELYIPKNYIGFLYAFASILTIVSMLQLPKILTKYGNRATTVIFAFLCFIALIFLAFIKIKLVFLFAFVLFFISSHFIIATLDIFIEDFSDSRSVGKLRGIYLTSINMAWVVAQMISGSIIAKSSFKGIYLYSAFLMLPLIFIFRFFLQNFKDPVYENIAIKKTIRIFIKDKHLSKIYLINLVLRFFFAWMIIYMTIHLHQNIGFSWDKIGFIYAIMLLPFVLLSYPLGKLSDQIGEKKLLILGFLFMIVFTSMIPFIHTTTMWIWASILFLTRVGAATVEVMSESYFFKIVSEEHADAIAFFRNTGPIAFTIAPLLAVPILIYIPEFSYLFFVLSAILLGGFLITLRLKDIK